MATLHAFEFLEQTSPAAIPSVCVTFGDETFLRREVTRLIRRLVADESADVAHESLDAEHASWRDVIDKLSTYSLFGGGGKRLVVVENAKGFVSANRDALESYVERPKPTGVLILDVDQWPANTRLYKSIDKSGLQIDCRPPEKAKGRGKSLDEARITKWLVDRCSREHDAKLDAAASRTLLELVGPQLGILDQDLAKLAVYAGTGGRITDKMVTDIVGGWRTKTVWDLIDAALDGKASEALHQLDLMFRAGEYPLAIFGPMASSLRRFANATRIYQSAEKSGRAISLREALLKAGMPNWPAALEKAERQIKQLGRIRAAALHRWLLDLDLALKGSHSSPERARFALEQLVLRLSQAAAPKSPRTTVTPR